MKANMKDGVKYDACKTRYDLIPAYPLEQLARLYTFGATKYADNNWRKGLRWGRCFAAMMRHAWLWWGGEDCDKETGLSHMAAVAFCAFSLMEFSKTHKEFDDRVKTQAKS